MTFDQLGIGDWFIFNVPEKGLYIKTDFNTAYCLDNYTDKLNGCIHSHFYPDEEITPCTRYAYDKREYGKSLIGDTGMESTYTEHEFLHVPVGSYFASKLHGTCYRKISSTHYVTVWSTNLGTMGKIFERRENAKGVFIVFNRKVLEYPEIDGFSPFFKKVLTKDLPPIDLDGLIDTFPLTASLDKPIDITYSFDGEDFDTVEEVLDKLGKLCYNDDTTKDEER